MSIKTSQLGRVLVVDDDIDMVAILQNGLVQCGYAVSTCCGLAEMKEKIKKNSFDAILLDLYLGEETGIEALPFLMREAPHTVVIVMTAKGSIEMAVKAMGEGAASFIAKGTDVGTIVQELGSRLESRANISLSSVEAIRQAVGFFGQSPAINEVIGQIERFKATDATVLITGETGTGKEVAARFIHRVSPRGSKNFAALNCAAIPENLLESELFGHKRGAFTDAKSDRQGIFELCSDGTLLLDEIGEMPLSLQAKLLRVLQEKEITPVGASRPIKIQTRVLAATNKDLEEEIAHGRFREDLYFRLNILSISLPPLRERTGDLAVLSNAFIKKFNERYSKDIAPITRDILVRLEAYAWPGNIRELQNGIERAVVLSQDNLLHIEDVLQRKKTKKANTQGG